MKALFIILFLAVIAVVVAKQPWDGMESLLSVQAPSPSSADSPSVWRRWLQDDRVPLLAQRLELLEQQANANKPSAEPGQQWVALEGRVAELARVTGEIPRLQSGTVVVKKGEAGWKLTDLFARIRQYRQSILFESPFPVIPKIVLGITLIDLPGEKV
ncbi:MAG: hypothetical protein HQL80_12510, partial [Magnetococcales bacterium]|nr:hypothetical protein [Magnetococcales bacterium]